MCERPKIRENGNGAELCMFSAIYLDYGCFRFRCGSWRGVWTINIPSQLVLHCPN